MTKKSLPRAQYDFYNEMARKMAEHREAWKHKGLSMAAQHALYDLGALPGQKIELTTDQLADLLEQVIDATSTYE